jgi:hypothetical protein
MNRQHASRPGATNRRAAITAARALTAATANEEVECGSIVEKLETYAGERERERRRRAIYNAKHRNQ